MIRNLFSRLRVKKRNVRESAPSLTRYERMALEVPGVKPDGLSYALLDEMQKDSMIQTAISIKKLGSIAAETQIAPADSSAEAHRRAEFVEEAFERMEGSPRTILESAMDAFAKGWSLQELIFEESGGRIWLARAQPKNPAQFGLQLDAFGNVERLRLRLPGEVERELPREKFAIYVNRSSYGLPMGRSDLEAAYPHWASKQALLKAWRFHMERFASPTVTAQFQRGVPESERAEMLGALNRLQDVTSIVFPNDFEVGVLGGNKESSTGFQDAIEFHNREMARAILGQTLTTDEGRRVGSLALGKVHLQVLLLQLHAVRRELADSVMTEQVIRPLVEMNFGPGLIPRFEFSGAQLDAFAEGKI